MKHEQDQWLKLAVAIQAARQNQQAPQVSVELPAVDWQTCQVLARWIETARQRGWRLAAARLQRDFGWQVQQLRNELDHFSSRLGSPETAAAFATVGDIYHDLLAICEEFEEVTHDPRERTLSVVTESIVLEGVYLGPFEIQLKWGQFAGVGLPHYCVVAVAPQPAGANDSVTHPHVQDDSLCEGDARRPLRQALEQGRLLDFFLIVAGVLRTYNDGSPFVALAEWDGTDCSDCGRRVAADDRWGCERCGDDVCDECRISCAGCDSVFCSGCVSRCAECETDYCSGCLPTRRRGESPTCPSCLEEAERDDDCHDEACDEEEQDHGTGAAVQPDGVGQAVVSA